MRSRKDTDASETTRILPLSLTCTHAYLHARTHYLVYLHERNVVVISFLLERKQTNDRNFSSTQRLELMGPQLLLKELLTTFEPSFICTVQINVCYYTIYFFRARGISFKYNK